ncbi:MAG TPA: hypothetical protein VGP99_03130 [Tepidisphaeraceae bacterium]|jgi:hypothetical protein|nr:hypothetical protein [Tepidisphaeraceae bacterium]
MITKFTKIGDSWGLVFDPAILELFKIDADTQFEVTTKDGRLFIRRPSGMRFPTKNSTLRLPKSIENTAQHFRDWPNESKIS